MTKVSNQEKSAHSGRPLRLLIVEDNPVDAELEIETLKGAGYLLSVEIVDSAKDFKQRLQQNNYDIILCDHDLGTWTGKEA